MLSLFGQFGEDFGKSICFNCADALMERRLRILTCVGLSTSNRPSLRKIVSNVLREVETRPSSGKAVSGSSICLPISANEYVTSWFSFEKD